MKTWEDWRKSSWFIGSESCWVSSFIHPTDIWNSNYTKSKVFYLSTSYPKPQSFLSSLWTWICYNVSQISKYGTFCSCLLSHTLLSCWSDGTGWTSVNVSMQICCTSVPELHISQNIPDFLQLVHFWYVLFLPNTHHQFLALKRKKIKEAR